MILSPPPVRTLAILFAGLLLTVGADTVAQVGFETLPATITTIDYDVLVPAEPSEPFFLPPSTPTAPSGGGEGGSSQANGDRVVYWVHGLTGDRTAWQPVASDIADDLKTAPRFVDYADFQAGHDLRTVATGIEPQLLSPGVLQSGDPNIDPSETIYIGHSLGGIMGRELIRLQSERDFPLAEAKFRGLATVSTPHNGSELAGAREEVPHLIEEACHALADGPVLEIVADIPDIPKLDWFKIVVPVPPYPIIAEGPPAIDLTETAKEFLAAGCKGTAFNPLTGALVDAALLPTVADDIDFDSPELADLAAQPDPYDVYKANIIASEDEPVVWKLLSSVTGGVQSLPAYAANDDGAMEALVHDLVAERELAAFALDNEADYIDGFHQHYHINPDGQVDVHDWSLLKWPKGNRADELREAAQAYREGIAWFDNLEHQWLVLQGARTSEIIGTRYHCQCTPVGNGVPGLADSYYVDDPGDCFSVDEGVACQPVFLNYETRDVDVATDGAATVPSQEAWFEDDGSLVPQFEVEGSNHIQIRNDRNTEIAVKQWLLMGGAGGEAPDFKTDERG